MAADRSNGCGGPRLAILLGQSPGRAAEEPQQAANRCKKHYGFPGLRIGELAGHDRHQDRDCCKPAHQGYRQTDQANDDPEKPNHLWSSRCLQGINDYDG